MSFTQQSLHHFTIQQLSDPNNIAARVPETARRRKLTILTDLMHILNKNIEQFEQQQKKNNMRKLTKTDRASDKIFGKMTIEEVYNDYYKMIHNLAK